MNDQNIEQKINQLGEKYAEQLNFFESNSTKAKVEGKVSSEDLFALGQQLENFDKYVAFSEANGSVGDMGVIPNIGLDVITASAAQSVVPLMAAVQPMQEQQGTVYFKNIVSGTGRGGYTNGQTLLSARGGRRASANGFAGEEVTGEDTGVVGDDSAKVFNFVVESAPVRVRSVEVTIEGTDVKLIDDAKGNLIGVGGSGTINYETGEVEVTFLSAPVAGAKVFAGYATNFEVMSEIPTIRSEYESVGLRAKTFALRSDIGLFKSFELSNRFGINVNTSIAKDLTGELTAEVSNAVVAEAYMNAQGVVTWGQTPPSTAISYSEHKLSFFDAIAEAESKVLLNSGRTGSSAVLIASSGAAAVIRTMPGFVPADIATTASGAHFFGTLDGKVVIRSLALPAKEILFVSKGTTMFDNSLIYAPYMPLVVTSLMQGQDHNPLKAQKGVALQAGIKAVVPQMITKIVID